jgi:serine/threonine protein kinase
LNFHPAISFFIGVCTEPEHLCFITKYYSKGSAYDLLVKENLMIDWKLVIKIARDAASGIFHLHRERVIHCDIAARNILVGDDWSGYVSDFGMSRIKKYATIPCARPSREGPIRWMAPELLLNRQSYSFKSDSWSFAVMLWEFVVHAKPYANLSRDEVVSHVTCGNTLAIPVSCPTVLAALMKDCWNFDPELRPSFANIWKRLSDYYIKLDS